MRTSFPAFGFLLGLLTLPVILSAQWRGPRLSFLGPEDGLYSIVYDITQDSTGYLYFGTNVGLYRYDGHHFEFFVHDPRDDQSIGPGDVYRVHEGRDGLIWMTLRFGGLNSFDPKTGVFHRYPMPALPYVSDPGASSIFEAQDGTLWVGAAHFRLLAFNRQTGQFTTYTPDWIDPQTQEEKLNVLSIVPDPKDRKLLWLSVLGFGHPKSLADSYGIVSFDTETKQFHSAPCFGETRWVDHHGRLWGTHWSPTITRFDPASGECKTYQYQFRYQGQEQNTISQDIEPYQDKILVTTAKAIIAFDSVGDYHIFSYVPSPAHRFTAMYTDRDKNLWIGTNQGAYILDPDDQQIRYFSLDQFGMHSRIYPGRLAYYPPGNEIYLSNISEKFDHRIYRIPVGQHPRDHASVIETEFPVYGIACDQDDQMWVCGKGGFYKLNPGTGAITATALIAKDAKPLPWAWNMRASSRGWIGTIGRDEFIWFHTETQKVTRLGISDLPKLSASEPFENYFDGFTFGNGDYAYLFTNGIFQVDLKTGAVIKLRYDKKVNPSFQQVQYVGEGPSGDVWVSTFEMVGRFQVEADSLILKDVFTSADGMISPSATELHFDDRGRVWAFTPNGINCIDPQTREVRYFGTKEGLPDPFIDPRQVISIAGGQIATVNSNGLIVFNADALWNSVALSDESVVINEIRISGERYHADQSANFIQRLDLKPGQSLVDISFQGLAYPTDFRLEYSYRIKGIHDDWISIGQNKFVTLPSLAPGDYLFEVKAGNPHSHAPVKSLVIHMGKALYQQAWFIILVVMIAAGLIYLWYRRRIGEIRRQEAENTAVNKKIAELELKALRSQMNPHFMFNSLNSIKNYILHAEPKLAAEYLSNFAHLIRMILQNSREKVITLQEELETLILYIELEQLRFEEAFEFSCVVDDGVQLEQVKIPPMLLQPYIENAIWHGLMHKKSPGHLLLQFSRENNSVLCTVEDDGVGRAAAQELKSLSAVRYKSMGMGITKDRIEIMNKMDALGISAEVTDKYDADGKPSGTRVVIRIPLSNEFSSSLKSSSDETA